MFGNYQKVTKKEVVSQAEHTLLITDKVEVITKL
jgi:hypothetical protein